MQSNVRVVLALAIAVIATSAMAQEFEYFSVQVGSADGRYEPEQVVSREAIPNNAWYQMESEWRVSVDAGSEAYLVREGQNVSASRVLGRRPKGVALKGSLYALQRSQEDNQKSVLVRWPFSVPEKLEGVASKQEFLTAKGRYFEHQWAEQHAGAAIWRHLATKSLAEVGLAVSNPGPNWPLRPNDGVDDTIQLMSGGRAVSENLQLDRQLAVSNAQPSGTEVVDLKTINGITIAEVNWLQRIGGAQVELDPLASRIPHDQFALFVPSFEVLAELVDNGQRLAKPLVQWFEPQSRSTDALSFYQKQMGLSLGFASRQIGAALIDEVAITASDPYFRTGTDIALLMQTKKPELLSKTIAAQVALAAARFSDSQSSMESVEGVSVECWKTSDRQMSSFVAQLPEAVVISNSLNQVRQIVMSAAKKRTSMGELGEYKFFRHRYVREPGSRKSLLMITDAAIRRWCGPEWRIAASRRTRARAEIAELTVRNMNAILLQQTIAEEQIHDPTSLGSIGEVYLNRRGVRSDRFGTLDFQIPIAEMDIKTASRAEVTLYENWRNRYQNLWRNVFDPIAIEVELSDKAINADLSIIPLIMNSSYQWLIAAVGNERLKNEYPAEHSEAILSAAMAIDTNAPSFEFLRRLMNDRENVNFLSWVDGEIEWHVDYDQQWFDLQSQTSPWKLGSDYVLQDLPIGIFVPSRDNLRMAAFVVAIRATTERLVPNLLTWTESEGDGMRYVIGTLKDGAMGSAKLPRIYYATLPSGFLLSTNERVFRRMIAHRMNAEVDVSKRDGGIGAVEKGIQQPQYAVRITGKGVQFNLWNGWNDGMRRMSRIAWSNIPVLNYLRSQYPNQDPLKAYEQLFGERLIEPAGGDYVWNDELQTYESSLYGHHLAPKAGPAMVVDLQPKDVVQASLSFQDGGLRARLQLDHRKAPE